MRVAFIIVLSFFTLVRSEIFLGQQDSSARNENLPPGEKEARGVLDKSPRHGEWVDVSYEGSKVPIRSWIVYPERKDMPQS
jgi:hypothetical protein